MAGKVAAFVNHPELREGEMFFTNIAFVESAFFNEEWEANPLKTKRLGDVAIDDKGKPITSLRPVFVRRAELIEAGIDPDYWVKNFAGT